MVKPEELIQKGYIPFDKSWIIRMGVLDLVSGSQEIDLFLSKNQNILSDDLKSLKISLSCWRENKPVDVGESGTLYRFLKFASWKLGLNKQFILRGTLKNRKITDNPDIVNLPLNQLLNLDNKTSQWASASVLLGNQEKIENPPFKLKLTYEALEYWKTNKPWKLRYDETILAQAVAYLQFVKEGRIFFIPQQAEDYCFAKAFNLITPGEGEMLWASLRGHESDRIKEMEEAIIQSEGNREITSRDHRVVQAIVMSSRGRAKIANPSVVSKSWPQFWDFIKASQNL